jgi:hypothetical protein
MWIVRFWDLATKVEFKTKVSTRCQQDEDSRREARETKGEESDVALRIDS